MRFTNLTIPLDIVLNGANMILTAVMPYYTYVDGKKTENIEGYRYYVVEDKTFEKLSVKIPSVVPAISKEEIENAKNHIRVTFDNAIAKPYRTQSGEYELSVTATAVSVVK